MSAPAPPAPAATLAVIIDLLCDAVAARGRSGWLGGVSVFLVWTRLRRLGARFTRLAARIDAGQDIPRPRRATPRPNRPRPPPRLPRNRFWLVRLVPEAASAGSQLQHLLATPEMAALIASSPRAGRLLRPLCRTLAVTLPPALVPPPRPARPTAPADPRPEGKPTDTAPDKASDRPRSARSRRPRRDAAHAPLPPRPPPWPAGPPFA